MGGRLPVLSPISSVADLGNYYATVSLFLDAEVERVLQGFGDVEGFGGGVEGVEEEVGGVGHEGAGHLEQRGFAAAQPIGAEVAGVVELRLPALDQLASYGGDFQVGCFDAEEGEVRGDVVGGGVDADFEEGGGGAFAQVDDWLAGVVPAAGSAEAADAAEVAGGG